jgi:hypothetical protein
MSLGAWIVLAVIVLIGPGAWAWDTFVGPELGIRRRRRHRDGA